MPTWLNILSPVARASSMNKITAPKLPTKTTRVFNALMTGKSFNRFEAERELHDHCLHSTVSVIERKHRITISRKRESVPGYMGSPTYVFRYWIKPEERKRIQENKHPLNG